MPISKEKGETDLRQKFQEFLFFFHMFPMFYSKNKENISYLDLLSWGNMIWFNSSAGSLHVILITIFQVVILDLLDLFLFAPIGASIGPSSVVIRVLSNRCVLQCEILDDILKYFSQGL